MPGKVVMRPMYGDDAIDLMNMKATELLEAIKHNRESSITAGNNAETIIKRHADDLRAINRYSGGRAYELISGINDGMAKYEVMRFLSTIGEEDYDKGLDLAQWCMTSEVGFDNGVLNRILNESKNEGLPIEWIASSMLGEKQFRHDDDSESFPVNGMMKRRNGKRTPKASGFDRDAIMMKLKN